LKKDPHEDARLDVERLRDSLTLDFWVLQSYPQSQQSRGVTAISTMEDTDLEGQYDLDNATSGSDSEMEIDAAPSGGSQSRNEVIPPE
jgi:hypothetical protein